MGGTKGVVVQWLGGASETRPGSAIPIQPYSSSKLNTERIKRAEHLDT